MILSCIDCRTELGETYGLVVVPVGSHFELCVIMKRKEVQVQEEIEIEIEKRYG